MLRALLVPISLILFSLASQGHSEAKREKFLLGSTSLTPCSKLDWVKSSIPGLKAPKVTYCKQELAAYYSADFPNNKYAEDTIKKFGLCVVGGAAGSMLASIFGTPASALPTFNTIINSCVQATCTNLEPDLANILSSSSFEFTSKCYWEEENLSHTLDLTEYNKRNLRSATQLVNSVFLFN